MVTRLSLEQVPSFGVDQLDDMYAAAFSPDRSFLATGGQDGVVRLWDAAGSRLIRTIQRVDGEDDGRVRAIAFGGGRPRVLAASFDSGRVLTWSPADGQRLSVLVTGQRYLRAIAVHPGGTLLAAGIGDVVRLWDPTTGRAVCDLAGHTDRVTQVAFHARRNRLASAGMDGIRLWNPVTGRLIRVFRGHVGSLTAVAFDPAGDRLAGTGATAAAVRIWHTRTGQELAAIGCHGDTPSSMAFSPDGRLLALGNPGRSLRLWDTATGTEVCALTGRRMGAVSAVLFSPDGTHLVTVAGRANRAGQRRLPPGSFDRAFARWRVREIDVEPTSADAERTSDSVEPADVPVPAPVAGHQRILRHPRIVHSVAFSTDGSRLVTNDGTVRVWRRDGGEAATTMVETAAPPATTTVGVLADVLWSPDGTLLAYVRDLTRVVLADPDTGREVRSWDCLGLGVSSLAFSPDGSQLAGSLGDHSIAIWDPSTGHELRRLAAPPSVVSVGPSTMMFSPDGARLAKGAENGSHALHLWHVGTGELRQLSGHTGSVAAVAFDPSGARIASGGLDRSVVLWDAATGDEISQLVEHTGAVRAVAFSPDGTRLATACSDGVVHLRDPVTGAPTHRLTGHIGMILSIAFSPDGAQLATAGTDATARVWDLPAAGD